MHGSAKRREARIAASCSCWTTLWQCAHAGRSAAPARMKGGVRGGNAPAWQDGFPGAQGCIRSEERGGLRGGNAPACRSGLRPRAPCILAPAALAMPPNKRRPCKKRPLPRTPAPPRSTGLARPAGGGSCIFVFSQQNPQVVYQNTSRAAGASPTSKSRNQDTNKVVSHRKRRQQLRLHLVTEKNALPLRNQCLRLLISPRSSRSC